MQWFWLAEKLHQSVEWCLDNISSSELSHWLAYDDITSGRVKVQKEQRQSPAQMLNIFKTVFKGK